jgi:hypothetical protein
MTRCGLDAVLVARTAGRRVGCARRHAYASAPPAGSTARAAEPRVGCRRPSSEADLGVRWRGRRV